MGCVAHPATHSPSYVLIIEGVKLNYIRFDHLHFHFDLHHFAFILISHF